MPISAGKGTNPADTIPVSLNLTTPVDALVISHPHQDHFGLLPGLSASWPVWCGAATEVLMRVTAGLSRAVLAQQFNNYRPGSPFSAGPFSITPYLTDHSAFDAHMLLVDCAGTRILYSGDFRRTGRKAVLVDRLMNAPPVDLDVLLLEGTTLGRTDEFPTEADLEDEFVSVFRRTTGRVFVTWSAQNIDRTVTIYRACKRSGRTLVLDLYAVDVLERMSALYDTLPRLGWSHLQAVVTSSMKRLYESPGRMNAPTLVERCVKSGRALGAGKLQSRPDGVVMLRPNLLRDFTKKGMTIEQGDAWVFSMWSGYLGTPEYEDVRRRFESAGATFAAIHTSGHASPHDLEVFAARMAPRYLVPIHSFTWDDHVERFSNVRRLRDGEPLLIA
jgi:ribonuclease J